MKQITIQLKDAEEETFVTTFLKKMKIKFHKEDSELDDFELTDEMKRVIDERLKEDRSTYMDASVVMEELDKKYGL